MPLLITSKAHVYVTAWDIDYRPTNEELAERRSGILAVASKLRALSDAAEVRKISRSEFDALSSELFVAQFSGVITEDLVKAHEAITNPSYPAGWSLGLTV